MWISTKKEVEVIANDKCVKNRFEVLSNRNNNNSTNEEYELLLDEKERGEFGKETKNAKESQHEKTKSAIKE